MRKEILRIEHVVCLENDSPILNHVSMHVFQGEVYGILCLERHGIDTLVNLICYNQPIQYGQVFYEESLVNSIFGSESLRNHVTLIGNKSRLIDNLSVADNLYVIRFGYKKKLIPEKKIYQKAVDLLAQFKIDLNPDIFIEELTIYQRLVIELLRAIIDDNKLIILWQISDLLSSNELPEYHRLIQKMAKMGFSFVYIYNHHEVLKPICDRIGIFANGRIEKVFLQSDKMENEIMSVYARYAYDKLMKIKSSQRENFTALDPVVELKHIKGVHIKDLSLTIRPGENILLLDQSNTILYELLGILNRDKNIAVIPRDPTHTTLFPELSYLDNLCFPLSEKVPHFWSKKSFRNSILKEYEKKIGEIIYEPQIYGLHSKDLYTLVYERFLISRPKLIVCMQPLSGVDMYIRSYILEMIKQLCDEGIAVLVLNTELYDTLFAADRIVQVENGKTIGIYDKDEIDRLKSSTGEIYPD